MNVDDVLNQARETLQNRFLDFSDAPDAAPSKKKINKLSLTVESVKVGGKKYGIGKGVVSFGTVVPWGMPNQSLALIIKVGKPNALAD